VQSVGSFIAMALLARILNPQEFGRWVLLEPLVLLGAQLSIFGTNYGIIKLIAQDKISISQASYSLMRYVLWIYISVVGLSIIGAYIFYSKNVTAVFIGIWLASEGLLVLFLSGFRGANEPFFYVVSVLIRTGIIVFGLFLFWYTGITKFTYAENAALLWGVASAVSCIVLFIGAANQHIARKEHLLYSPIAAKNGTNYGLPILLGAILAAVIGNGDRYVLGAYVDTETVGHYVMYAKIASALNLMVTPFNLWWPTARFLHLGDPDGGAAFFSRATLQMLFAFTFIGSSLWLLAPTVLTWLAPGVIYSPAIGGALIVAALAVAMSSPLNIGLLKEGNTKWIPIILLISVAVQMGLALVFVRHWDGLGVACATAVSATLSLILQRLLSQRFHPVNLPYFKMFAVLAFLGLSAYLVSLSVLQPLIRIMFFGIAVLPIVFILRKQLWPFVK
jgi:O-antigen/teichoic acid export membrane protein